MKCAVSSSSVEQCALCADSTHDVHHAIVEVKVVIGVLVVHCELLVVRVVPVVVCDDAVVRRTLVLIAVAVAFVFVVAIFHRILLYWRYIGYTSPSVTVNCVGCYRILNCKCCTKSILRIIPRIIGPITVHQVSPINQCWVHRRGDAQMKNATRILASSTKMRKSFVTFGNRLYLLGV